ncbi:thioredoxin reductase [Halovivax ruber XH-70]|uniref:Thioredoxin reductase n=1 Tax=Halovivax ruber (strain DSM 18193 / JCM 13892 / XH-70) TaxID=797302 RepID=L0IGW1_HALRX|nr:FAD-dependent oxidoreductase [Halovivax ruber]AGB17217.1 thioredoxin reductase [Halovivax ruber XH-70]
MSDPDTVTSDTACGEAADGSADDKPRPTDYDVVIVGGGPAGCAAGVFTARYGLDTVIFDRGNSSLQRCAFLENYLGFPAGIDVGTFTDLIHDHAREAGCELVDDMVASVRRTADAEGDSDTAGRKPIENVHSPRFVVETQDGRQATPAHVLTATRYGGEYLRPLDDGGAMFRTFERDGESTEYFDPAYADADGRTPIDGLYVASPSGDRDTQVVTAAGQGGHVARSLIRDRRREQGYPEPVADYWDWFRRAAELPADEREEHWRSYFDERVPDDHGLGEAELAALRATDVDRLSQAYCDPAAVDERTQRGYDRLLDHVGEERIRAYLNESDAQ